MTEQKQETQIKKPSNYFKSFDGIRGTCCFMVLLVHYVFTGFNLPSSIVYIGLHCFFIMSAFLITKNLLRDKERSANFKQCFNIFYIKRTSRILPVYVFYMLLTLILLVLFKFTIHQTFGMTDELKKYGLMLITFTYNLKMLFVLQNGTTDYLSCIVYPHLWSLSLEEQFYIVIIFLAWIANRKTLQIVTVVFVILIPIIRILGYFWIGTKTQDEHLRTLILWQSPMFQFDAFFYGIAIAVFDFKKTKIYLYLFVTTFLLIAAFGFVNAYICSKEDGISIFKALREDQYFYRNYGYLFMDSLVNFFCVLWFLSVIYYPEKFKILANKLVVRFGELTYGLYVFQFLFLPFGLITARLLQTHLHIPVILAEIAGVTLYIVMNFYFSSFVYNKLETPIIIYKDKLLKRLYGF
jgi:peptidoglycan/LPS O-acetylase OafA/YrhL